MQYRSTDCVVPGVSDHSGTQALAPPSQQPEHQAIDSDQNDARSAFVTMCCSKDGSRDQYAGEHRTSDAGELKLQVSTENDLFAEARCRTDREPDQQFKCRIGNEKPELAAHAIEPPSFIEVHQLGAGTQYCNSCKPESGRNDKIDQNVLGVGPATADQFT